MLVVSRVNNMAIVDMTTKACQIVSYRMASSWVFHPDKAVVNEDLDWNGYHMVRGGEHGLDRSISPTRGGGGAEGGGLICWFFFSRSEAWGGDLHLKSVLFSIFHFPLCRVADA